MARSRHEEVYRTTGRAPGYGAVRSSGWSVTLWASVLYLVLCLGSAIEKLGQPLVGGLDWLWPRPLEHVFEPWMPLGLVSFVIASGLGYAAIVGLTVLWEIRGPKLSSTWARAAVALVICCAALSLVTVAAIWVGARLARIEVGTG